MTETVSELYPVDLPPQSCTEIIETVITTLSDDAHQLEIDAPQKAFRFHYGTVEVYVYLTGQTSEDALLVWAPVIKLPVRDEAGLMRYLLEKNWWTDTMEAAFCLRDDQIILTTSRTLADLDPGEVSRSITVVASLADEYDELLMEKFN
ncbi:YbjN domain-containing protein [Anthocerotibacter panamensis]|uniref:YbjN domain-containing protein n=1 Tax=Anthocerotibacter panamensis TaxID=2857077 RepID=UPI001C405113|nr:YbjN domain-containing protein [Anthocerotibacter panamensis]